jgi:hypothetical protein
LSLRPRTLRSVGATGAHAATRPLETTSRGAGTAALDTGCDCKKVVLGTAMTAPGTRRLAYTMLVTLVVL